MPIVVLQMDKDAWQRNSLDHRERVTTLTDEQFKTVYEYLSTNFGPHCPVPKLPKELLKTWTGYEEVFNWGSFLAAFAVFTVLYYAAAHRFRWVLLLASLAFYATFNVRYVPLLILVTAVAYGGGWRSSARPASGNDTCCSPWPSGSSWLCSAPWNNCRRCRAACP